MYVPSAYFTALVHPIHVAARAFVRFSLALVPLLLLGGQLLQGQTAAPFYFHYDLGGNDRAVDMLNTPNGYMVFGHTDVSGDWDIFMTNIDTSGVQQWVRLVAGTGNQYVYEVLEQQNGYVIMGLQDSPTDSNIFVTRTDLQGNVQWTTSLGDANTNQYVGANVVGQTDRAKSIIATSDGGYLVMGATNNLNDCYVAKLSNAGALQWESTHDMNDIIAGLHMAITAAEIPGNGGYLVFGSSRTGSAFNNVSMFMLKLSPAGAYQTHTGYRFASNPAAVSLYDVAQLGPQQFELRGSVTDIIGGGPSLFTFTVDDTGNVVSANSEALVYDNTVVNARYFDKLGLPNGDSVIVTNYQTTGGGITNQDRPALMTLNPGGGVNQSAILGNNRYNLRHQAARPNPASLGGVAITGFSRPLVTTGSQSDTILGKQYQNAEPNTDEDLYLALMQLNGATGCFGQNLTSATSNEAVTTFAPNRVAATNPGQGALTLQRQNRTVNPPFNPCCENYSVDFTAPNQVCINSLVTFTDNSNVLPTSTLDWDFGDGNGLTGAAPGNQQNLYASGGNYNITLIGNDPVGCTDTATGSIEAVNAPTVDSITFSPNDSVCAGAGDQVTLRAFVSPANPTYAYNWIGAGIVGPNTQPSVTVQPVVSTTYTVTVVNPAGNCTGNATQTITVVNPIQVTAGNEDTICPGDPAPLNAVVGGVAGGSFQWSPTVGLNNPTLQNPTARPNQTLTYTVLYTDPNGCQSEDSVTIDVRTVGISPPGGGNVLDTINLCPAADTVIYRALIGGGNPAGCDYTWYRMSDGAVMSDTDTVALRPASTESYYLESSCPPSVCVSGSISRDTLVVRVPPVPTVNLSVDPAFDSVVCASDTTVLNATGADTYTLYPALVGSDSLAPGRWSVRRFTPDTNSFQRDYWVIGANTFGCRDSDTVTIDYPQTPQVASLPDTHYCTNDTHLRLSVVPPGITAPNSWEYVWNNFSGLTDADPGGPTLDSVLLAPPVRDQYVVYAIAGNCTSATRDTFTVIRDRAPVPSIQYQDPISGLVPAGDTITDCEDQLYRFQYTFNTLPDNVEWTIIFPDTSLPPRGSNILAWTITPDTVTIRLTAQSPRGCEGDTADLVVMPQPLPSTNYNIFPGACLNDQDTFQHITLSDPNQSLRPNDSAYVNLNYTDPQSGNVPIVSIAPGGDSLWGPFIAEFPDTGRYSIPITTYNQQCSETDTPRVQVFSRPTIDAGPDLLICPNTCDSLRANVQNTDGLTGCGYIWTPFDGLSNPFELRPEVCPDTTTTYYLQAICNGCEAQNVDSVTVTVRPEPDASINLVTPFVEVCQGNSAVLPGSGSGGTGTLQYQWFPAVGLNNPGIAQPTVTPDTTRDYQFLVTDAQGCNSDTQTVRVLWLPRPIANAGPDKSYCLGANTGVFLDGRVDNQSQIPGGFSYAWSPNYNLSDSSTQRPRYTPGPTDSLQVFTLTVTSNLGGCQSDPADPRSQVTVRGLTVPSLAPSTVLRDTICVGDTAFLQPIVQNCPANNCQYSWTPAASLDNGSAKDVQAFPTSTTDYFFKARVGDCEMPAETLSVRVRPRPVVSIAAPFLELCSPLSTSVTQAVDLTGPDSTQAVNTAAQGWLNDSETRSWLAQINTTVSSPAASTTYSWSPGVSLWDTSLTILPGDPQDPADDSLRVELVPDSTSAQPWVSVPANQDSQVYRLNATYSGCTTTPSLSDSLVVYRGLGPSVTVPDRIAICDQVTDSTEIPMVVTLPEPAPIQVSWFPPTGLSNPRDTNPRVAVDTSTFYDYVVTAAGCVVKGRVLVDIQNFSPVSILTTSNLLCAGTARELLAVGGGNNPSYSWSPVDGLDNPGADRVLARPPQDTFQYTVEATQSLCSDTDTITLITLPKPEAEFDVNFARGCDSLTAYFINNSVNATQHIWTFGDGDNSNLAEPTKVYRKPGVYQPQLIVRSEGLCADTATWDQPLVLNSSLQAGFQTTPAPPLELPISEAEIQFLDTTRGAVSWLWDFGDGATSTLPNPRHQYTRPGNYRVSLQVTDSVGCTYRVQSKFLYRIYESNFFVPEAFSPNGDGVNDRWRVDYTGMEPLRFTIHNRWGEVQYEGDNATPAWDGVTLDGDTAPADVYFYEVQIGQGEDLRVFKGTLTLVR